MKLLLDMNLSPGWVETLEIAEYSVQHWSSVGSANDSDTTIMQYAIETNSVICTQDLDFGLLLAATGYGKPSVLQIRAKDVLPEHIGRQVLQALEQAEAELEAGALVTVDPKKTRLRLLPLGRFR